jgi:drug/metabolite transporter (DMT)-like permease
VTSAGLWPFISGFFYWLGIAAFIKSIKEIGPNMAILITTTHPVWTSLAAVFILAEPFGAGELIGGALILLSVYQINSVKSKTA